MEKRNCWDCRSIEIDKMSYEADNRSDNMILHVRCGKENSLSFRRLFKGCEEFEEGKCEGK